MSGRELLELEDLAAPLFGTPRRPDRRTWASPPVLETLEARVFRRPFLAWQRYVLEVAGEVDPETGLLCYPTVGVSVGRQEGKSSLDDAVAMVRSLHRHSQRGAYVCQDRSIAADRLIDLATGPAARYVAALRRSNGKERVTWTNRSTWEIRAGTGKAGRGPSLDTVLIDEAALLPFAVIDALGPTQAARPDPQLWVTSNAGDQASAMFWHYTELGRDSATADPGTGVAWFEWGATEDDDRADPATWARAMPALGVTIAPHFVAAKLLELEREPERFDREYLNRWPPGMGGHDGLDLATWARAARPGIAPDAPVVIGLDVAADRSASSVALAGLHRGTMAVELVDRRVGTAWVASAVLELRRRHRGAPIVADGLTCASVIAELRRSAPHATVLELGPLDFAKACGAFLDALEADPPRVSHRGQQAGDMAAQAAVRRRYADAWAWSRTKSAGDISALVAQVVATWGSWTLPPPPPAPAVHAAHP